MSRVDLGRVVGYSAYELAVQEGYEGTLTQWLASLKGATGATGPQGPTGATGAQGPAGEDGEDGSIVTVSATGTATDTVQYITIDGVEKKLAGGGAAPVASVNGKTGTVVLDAEDVGALPDDTEVPTKTSDLTNDSGFLTAHQSLAAYRTSSAQDAIDADKQDKLIAGANITIAADGKTISATGGSSLSADGSTILNNSGTISTAIGGSRTISAQPVEYATNTADIVASIEYNATYCVGTIDSSNWSQTTNFVVGTKYTIEYTIDIAGGDTVTGSVEAEASAENAFTQINDTYIKRIFNGYVWLPLAKLNSTITSLKIKSLPVYTYNYLDNKYINIGDGLYLKDNGSLNTLWYDDNGTIKSKSGASGVKVGAFSAGITSLGGNNTANAHRCVAIGSGNSATNAGAVELGSYLTSSAEQVILGKYNSAVSNPFIVGNGTGNSARLNALAIDDSNNLKVKGNVYVGCNNDSTGGTLIDLSGLPFMVNYATFNAAAFTAAKAALNAGRLVYVNNVSDEEMGVGPLYNIPCFMTFTDDDNVEYLQFNMMDGSYFTTPGGNEGVSHALFKVFLTSTGNKNINIVEMSQTFSPQPTEDGPKMTALTVTTGDTTVFSLSDLNVEAGNYESGAHHYTINLAQATQAVAEGDYSFQASFDNGEERSGSCTLSLITEGGYYFFGQATSAGPFKDATLAPQGPSENLQYDLDIHIDGRN